MSEYTTEVRYICETAAGLEESVGYSDVQKVLDDSWDKIFDFDFPLFDENYKGILCKKILLHYYTREIGFETVGLWKLKLKARLLEIMPKFNALYNALMDESYAIKINPLNFVDYYHAHSGDKAGGHTNTNRYGEQIESSGENMSSYSDTPQGALTNVRNGTYLTSATLDQNSGNSSRGGGNDETRQYADFDNFLEHTFGKMPGESYAKVVNDWAENFQDVDMLVINSLNNLFMLVW